MDGQMGYDDEDDEYDDESMVQSQLQANEGLEQRLEQIKENIKKQRQETEMLSDHLSNSIAAKEFQIRNQKTLEELEEELLDQKEQYHQLQSSKRSKHGTRGGQSKEELEFELSKGSPVKSRKFQSSQRGGPGAGGGSSSQNLEKAYEELEREILEIKMKLHNSISANESNADPASTAKRRKSGRTNNQNSAKKNVQYKSGSHLKGSTGSERKKYTAQSAKSQGRRSGAVDSRSPTGTHGRNGEPLDDPDYSLSVSELNSNMGNSLMKSGARGMGSANYREER